jgi:hypothetical protein
MLTPPMSSFLFKDILFFYKKNKTSRAYSYDLRNSPIKYFETKNKALIYIAVSKFTHQLLGSILFC